MAAKPRVLIVGGIDVDARLELMRQLSGAFEFSVLGSAPQLMEKFQAEGFEYRSYTLGRRANPFTDLYTFAQLFFYFRRIKPDLVHAFDTKPCVWARLAARLAGVPVVIGTLPGLGSLYVNEGFVSRALRMIYQALQTLACRFSDLTIFQNRDDVRQFVAAGVVKPEKSVIILGSGVSTTTFNPTNVLDAIRATLRVELGLKPDKIVITMISRVIRSKGVMEFAYAAGELARNYPEVQFLLVGPDDQDSLERLNGRELEELKQSVTWPGARRDIPTVLAISDVFVLPSAYREGIPRVLLEAASMGLPIVTTDSPGCNEVVENDINGFLIPLNNSDALGRAIARLISDSELRSRFGEESRRRAVQRFDIFVIASQTRDVYRRLLAKVIN